MASPRQSLGGNSMRGVGTHSDRRRENLQSSQLGDAEGRSRSRESSSVITTHPQTFSASNSLTTETNESSNESYRNIDDTQELCVLDPDSEESQPVPSLIFNLGTVQRHSAVLFDRLNRDRISGAYYSTIIPQKPVSARALRLFLEHIDR